jgi:Heterokaryon incompatibility protein (HET)
MPPHIYRDLDTANCEIRLVHFHPGGKGDYITVTISHTNLAKAPLYEALSYVWGDASVTVPIMVDGVVFDIKTNLAEALYHIRSRDEIRTL